MRQTFGKKLLTWLAKSVGGFIGFLAFDVLFGTVFAIGAPIVLCYLMFFSPKIFAEPYGSEDDHPEDPPH